MSIYRVESVRLDPSVTKLVVVQESDNYVGWALEPGNTGLRLQDTSEQRGLMKLLEDSVDEQSTLLNRSLNVRFARSGGLEIVGLSDPVNVQSITHCASLLFKVYKDIEYMRVKNNYDAYTTFVTSMGGGYVHAAVILSTSDEDKYY